MPEVAPASFPEEGWLVGTAVPVCLSFATDVGEEAPVVRFELLPSVACEEGIEIVPDLFGMPSLDGRLPSCVYA